MKAHEAIKLLKADRKEFLEKYGIKSHLSKIPSELETELFGDEKKIYQEPEPAQTVDSAETELVEVKVLPKKEPVCPYTPAEIELGIRCLGSKSKQWEWRHILDG